MSKAVLDASSGGQCDLTALEEDEEEEEACLDFLGDLKSVRIHPCLKRGRPAILSSLYFLLVGVILF